MPRQSLWWKVVAPAGFEPATQGLGNRVSAQAELFISNSSSAYTCGKNGRVPKTCPMYPQFLRNDFGGSAWDGRRSGVASSAASGGRRSWRLLTPAQCCRRRIRRAFSLPSPAPGAQVCLGVSMRRLTRRSGPRLRPGPTGPARPWRRGSSPPGDRRSLCSGSAASPGIARAATPVRSDSASHLAAQPPHRGGRHWRRAIVLRAGTMG
jgi:hypothetical protein